MYIMIYIYTSTLLTFSLCEGIYYAYTESVSKLKIYYTDTYTEFELVI